MEKTSTNLYWLAGDRYVSVFRKQMLIKEIMADGKWELIEFSTKDSNEFASTIMQGTGFDVKNMLFVHDGSVPEPQKSINFIEKVIKNPKKKLIILEGDPDEPQKGGKIDKRTVMYKKFDDFLENYEGIIQSNGFPDRKLVPIAVDLIQRMISKPVNKKIIEELLEKYSFDYGITVNEIEKVLIYNNGKFDSLESAEEILSKDDFFSTEHVLKAIQEKDHILAIQECAYLVNTFNPDDVLMPLLGTIAESFSFLLHCLNAKSAGCKSPKEIGEYVASVFIKKDRPLDPYSAEKRYYFFKDIINHYNCREVGEILGIVNKMMHSKIYKGFGSRYIIFKLVEDIFNSFG